MLICTKLRRKILNTNEDKLNLLIRDRHLESVEVIKYHGVHVDCSLSWKDHLKSVTSKVSRGMGMLKQAKCYLPEACLQTLYSRIMEPYFWYCCSVWEPLVLLRKTSFKQFQNGAAGSFINSKFDAFSRPLIEGLGWKAIEESKTIVYKYLYGLALQYLYHPLVRNSAGQEL